MADQWSSPDAVAAAGAQPNGEGQTVNDREGLLAEVFVRLADTLADDFDVVEFLLGLSADAVRVLDSDAAGVMLADGRGGLRLVASSEERMRLLELFELQSEEGPCLDAFHAADTIQANAAEGLRRIEEYSLPLENERMRKAFGYPSSLAKILTIRRDFPAGRTTLILVKEKLGF